MVLTSDLARSAFLVLSSILARAMHWHSHRIGSRPLLGTHPRVGSLSRGGTLDTAGFAYSRPYVVVLSTGLARTRQKVLTFDMARPAFLVLPDRIGSPFLCLALTLFLARSLTLVLAECFGSRDP